METNSQPFSLATQAPERKIKVSYIIFVLFALLVILGSFFAGYKIGKTKQTTPKNLVETKQNNKIAKGQTYTNPKLGFSISIPGSWITQEQVEEIKNDTLDKQTTYFYSSTIDSIYQIQISSYLADTSQRADAGVFGHYIDKQSIQKIAGQETTKTLALNNDEVDFINYLFKKENRNYEIKIVVPNKTLQKNLGRPAEDIDSEFERIVNEYEAILSTLKFIDPNPNTTNPQESVDNRTDYKNTNLKR